MTSGMDRIAKLVDNPLLKEGREIVSVDTSKVDHVDILPAHVDIALRDNFEEISFDDALILERMREEGLSEAQIAQHRFHVSSDMIGSSAQRTYGRYMSTDKTVKLYPNWYIDEFQSGLKSHLARDPGVDSVMIVDPTETTSARASKTIYHEIRHVGQIQVDGDFDEVSARYSFINKMQYELGALASTIVAGGTASYLSLHDRPDVSLLGLSILPIATWAIYSQLIAKRIRRKRSYKEYFNHPVEIDARRAGEDAPDRVMKLVAKESVTMMDRTKSD